MLKTLLKSALIVILLAGIFFVGLQFWEKQKRKEAAKVAEVVKTPEPVAVPTLNHVVVSSSAEGATLELGEVPTAAYQFAVAPDGKSLSIQIPAVKVSLATPSQTNPHPLVSSIDVSAVPMGDSVAAVVKVSFVGEVTAKDRYMGKTLFVDLVAKVQATPTPEPTVAPKKVSKKSKPVRHSKPKAVAKVKKAKPAPVPVEEATPEEFVPAPEPTLAEVPTAPEAPVAEAPVAPAPSAPTDKGNTLDLDKLFAESQADAVTPPPAPEVEPQALETPTMEVPKVASLPPKTSGTFDTSKVMKDFPKIQNIDVTSAGGATIVKIDPEKKVKYRVLTQRNPGRINIEFLNANNALQTEYPSFPGTKVTKITTQAFRGQDYLVRVTIFVDGVPKYETSKQGNSVIVTIP